MKLRMRRKHLNYKIQEINWYTGCILSSRVKAHSTNIKAQSCMTSKQRPVKYSNSSALLCKSELLSS